MARDLWPDEEDAQAKNNNRQAIFRIHQDLAYHHDAKIIDTRAGVYMISEDVHITTDADEMEKLYEQTKHMPDTKTKLETLKKAFGLYRGRLFEAGEADMGSWMIPFTSAYN
jgi:DNA-binding SARP family transcriptional activator